MRYRGEEAQDVDDERSKALHAATDAFKVLEEAKEYNPLPYHSPPTVKLAEGAARGGNTRDTVCANAMPGKSPIINGENLFIQNIQNCEVVLIGGLKATEVFRTRLLDFL